MEDIDSMVDKVVSRLSHSANSGAVAGEPIVFGDVTLVVLSTLSFGLGGGGGEGEGRAKATRHKPNGPSSGLGEGVGGGVKVRPAAVVAFTPEGVSVLTIPNQPGVFDKIVDRVPEVVDMVDRVRHSLEQPVS
jgi:uncharacterized spore protein YtfJ